MAKAEIIRTIRLYVSKLPVFVPLRKNQKESGINLFLFDAWLKDNTFVSLLVPYTNGFIFGTAKPSIGNGVRERDLFAVISSNLRTFNTRKEYLAGRWDLDEYKRIDDWFFRLMEQQFSYLVGMAFEYFKVVKVDFGLHPVPALVLTYALGGIVQEQLVFLLTQKVGIDNPFVRQYRKDFFYFIDSLGLDDLFCWDERSGRSDRTRVVDEQ